MNLFKNILFKFLSYKYYIRLHHFWFLYRLKKALKSESRGHPQTFLDPELLFIASLLRSGDIFLDIGGYLGAWAIFIARKTANNTKVFTFEPVNFDMLIKTLRFFKYQNISAHKIALSDSTGMMKMRTPVHNGFPLLSTTHASDSLTHHHQFIEYEVEKTTLDQFIESHEMDEQKITAVKIDVEGAESPLLKGGEKFFTKSHPLVICEIWYDNNKKSTHSFFTERSYRAYKMIGPSRLSDVTSDENFEKITRENTYGNLLFIRPEFREFNKIQKFVE